MPPLIGGVGTFFIYSSVIAPTVNLELRNSLMRQGVGHEYFVDLPDLGSLLFRISSDDAGNPDSSKLRLFEDGVKLGPAHAPHNYIADAGQGAYSHWGQQLKFSTKDNSNPMTNGRAYSVEYELLPKLEILPALILIFILAAFQFRRMPKSDHKSWPETYGSCISAKTMAACRKGRFVILGIGYWLFIEVAAMFYLGIATNLPADRDQPHLYSAYRGHELKPSPPYRLPIHAPDGFRRLEITTLDTPDDTYRIFGFGGSVLYGVGAGGVYPPAPTLRNDETVTYFLENILNRKIKDLGLDKRIEIINAAVTGYHTFQHLVYLNERIVNYDADMYFFYDGVNDYYKTIKDFNHWRDYPYSSVVVADFIDNPTLVFSLELMLKPLSDVTPFFELLYKINHKRLQRALDQIALERTLNRDSMSLPTYIENIQQRAEETYLRAYRQIRAVAEHKGVAMKVFLQPQITFEDEALLSARDKVIQDITVREVGDGKLERAISAELENVFRKTGIEFHDVSRLAAVGTSDRQFYIDYAHFSPEGSKRAAELMAPFIWPEIAKWLADKRS